MNSLVLMKGKAICRSLSLFVAVLVATSLWLDKAHAQVTMPGRPADAFEVAEFPLRIEAPDGWEGGEVYLAATHSPGTAEEQTDRQLIPFGEGAYRTAPGRTMALRLEADGYWGRPKLITAETHAEPVVLTLLPAVRIEGTLKVGSGADLPEEVEILFETASGHKPPKGQEPLPRTKERCPVSEEGGFFCILPSLRLDLRISAEGYAPVYVWDAALRSGQTFRLGDVELKRGGSVSGWLESPDASFDLKEVQVEMEVTLAGTVKSPKAKQQLERRTEVGESRDGGFFQITGLLPGEYRLVAKHPSAGMGTYFPLRVEEGRETRLPGQVVLHPMAPIRVGASPPLDTKGRPWKTAVLELSPDRRAIRSQVLGNLDETGSWISKPLHSGTYQVLLSDLDGTRWMEQVVELAGEPADAAFFLNFVEVQGRLELGGEPVAGTVWFGGKRGNPSVKMVSDEGGAFYGLLPQAGKWRIAVETLEPVVEKLMRVEIEESGSGAAEVLIALGEGRIDGEVVDAQGRPVAGALVWFSELYGETGGPRQARTDSDGEFVFEAVEEGRHFLRAYVFSPEGTEGSPEIPVDVDPEHATPRVVLRLEPQNTLEGVVLSEAGPVTGATLLASLESSGGSIPPRAQSDVEGRFRLQIPARLSAVSLTVAPPGYSLACLTVYPQEGSQLVVPVSSLGGTVRVRGAGAAFALSKDGVPCSQGALQPWATTYGERGPDTTLPNMAPGHYRACRAGECDEGWLSIGGELDLQLEAQSASALQLHQEQIAKTRTRG